MGNECNTAMNCHQQDPMARQDNEEDLINQKYSNKQINLVD